MYIFCVSVSIIIECVSFIIQFCCFLLNFFCSTQFFKCRVSLSLSSVFIFVFLLLFRLKKKKNSHIQFQSNRAFGMCEALWQMTHASQSHYLFTLYFFVVVIVVCCFRSLSFIHIECAIFASSFLFIYYLDRMYKYTPYCIKKKTFKGIKMHSKIIHVSYITHEIEKIS